MADEIIDFELERGRHGTLLGREDVMEEVEALLAGRLGAGSSSRAGRGWARARCWPRELHLPTELPELRLRHPVRAGGNERTL